MKLIALFIYVGMSLYNVVLITHLVISILLKFQIISISNETLEKIWNYIQKIVNPVLSWIRTLLPPTIQNDITPVIAVIGLLIIGRLFRFIFL